MTSYEILLLLDPEVADERQAEIVGRMRDLIEGQGGTWSSHDPWGRRKLAYEIDHKGEGTYHLITFDANPETLDEVSRVLKITDGVLRHMAVRQVQGSRAPTRAEGAVSPPEYSANVRSHEEE